MPRSLALTQNIQAAVEAFERTQQALEDAEAAASPDEAELAAVRTQHEDALAAMETCLGARTETSVAFAAAKSAAQLKRVNAIQAVLERFGDGGSPLSAASTVEPSEPEARVAPEAPTTSEAVVMRYEPLQEGHVDLIIRLPASFGRLGIKVDATSKITVAPGGLFDEDYHVLGIDGKQYYPGLEAVRASPLPAAAASRCQTCAHDTYHRRAVAGKPA